MSGSADQEDGRALVVANEFAEVRLRRVSTHNGIRLEIESTRLQTAIRLDALQLEALTWQEPSMFSDLLVEPFGPPPGAPSSTAAS
ncbi:MAG: dihydrodiol dehydrogenase [Acidimicrobiales bacterium]